jgi:hypothetical protein
MKIRLQMQLATRTYFNRFLVPGRHSGRVINFPVPKDAPHVNSLGASALDPYALLTRLLILTLRRTPILDRQVPIIRALCTNPVDFALGPMFSYNTISADHDVTIALGAPSQKDHPTACKG